MPKPSKTDNMSGVLSRFLKNEEGNIIAIFAAAVLPMIGIVGGAVDMSRIYMTKARLQAACDAGALAGRKAMTATTLTTAAQNRANAMFDFNFVAADYQATGSSRSYSANAQGAVTGTARATLPTVLMKIFGKTETALSVTCGADLQVPNIDIVMVLDVTGSMDESINGVKKIESLKTSVKSFYTTIKNLVPVGSNSQIRFGFVPYSQAVNASGLFKVSPDATRGELPLSHIVDSMPVATRVANFNTPVTGEWTVDTSVTPTTYEQRFDKDVAATRQPFVASNTTGTNISNNDCERWSENRSFILDSLSLNVMLYPYESNSYTDNSGVSEFYQPDGSSTWQTTEPTSGTGFTKITMDRVSNTWNDNSGSTYANYQKCIRRITKTKYKTQSGYKFTSWTYKNVNFDVSQFKQGTAINYVSAIDSNYTVPSPASYDMVQLRALANQGGLTPDSFTWNGCLEERDTTAATSFAPIPAAAKDLNYVSGGTDDTLRWRPMMQELAWVRNGPAEQTTTSGQYQPGFACPVVPMQNLQVLTQAQVDAYANSLTPNGFTYLDVGLVWGLRMISPQGMWASRNTTGANGGQIQRYVIFMTDGAPVSQMDTYSAYGIEQVNRRITGSTGTSAATLHARRFQALCNTQTGSGAANLFVVGFGPDVTANLKDCVGNEADRYYAASNGAGLTAAFNNIANQIADLRLVQ